MLTVSLYSEFNNKINSRIRNPIIAFNFSSYVLVTRLFFLEKCLNHYPEFTSHLLARQKKKRGIAKVGNEKKNQINR